MFLKLLLIISYVIYIKADSLPCKVKQVDANKLVCVCNTDYCDTVSPLEKLEEGNFVLYTSSQDGQRFNKTKGTMMTDEISKYDDTITIESNILLQEINGWGGAFTDSAGIMIDSLDSSTTQEHLLRSYFSEEGLEYSLCRIPIGGTDFSTHGYTYDDGDVDVNLTNFKLTLEDYKYKLPFIRRAFTLSNNKLRYFASVWTAPKWMKTNNNYYGVGFMKTEMYQVWADYILKFFDEYKKEGIDFWGLTTQNEPSLSYTPFTKINSIAWTPSQMSTWVSKHLGPTIRKSQHSNLKLICLDDQRFFLPWYVDKLFQDKTTRNYIDGIGVHWYYNTIAPALLQTETHKRYPEKFILSTEACKGDKFWEKKVDLGSWSRGEDYAFDIIENTQNWATGWIDWNLALDMTGGPTYISNFVDSPIIVNATAGEFYKQPMFYAIGHFSKFIPPGSRRVQSTQTGQNVQSVAFKRPDNGTVLVILNMQKEDFNIKVVDNNNNKKGLTVTVSKHSINTIVFW